MTDDAQLLRQFAEENSEAAFRELVTQRIDFVYAAALRQVGGDTHLAQEVAQNVFLDLARKARALASRPAIAGWLYTSTRFAAAKALRSRVRRLTHETEAHAMNEVLSAHSHSDVNWHELRPVIDAAMHELAEADREAILLRFFEGRSLAEVSATVGVAENSARMRVERALEKLRMRLARRGITSTAAALGAALAAQPSVAAPAGLAATIFGSSLAGAALRGGIASAWSALDFMTKLKIVLAAATVVAAVGAGTYLIAQQTGTAHPPATTGANRTELTSLQVENQQLKTEVVRLQKAVADSAPSPLAEMRALVAASQQKLIQPILSLLRLDKEQLSPGFVSLFNLSADEKNVIEKELIKMRDELGMLAATNVAGVDHPSATTVVVRFKLFPEAGGKIHDRFVDELATTLGAERFAGLKTLMGDGFDWVVGSGFGAVEHSLTIERHTAGPVDDQRIIYAIFDRTQSPPGSPQRSQANVSQAVGRAALNQNYSWLATLLPADF